MTTTSCWWMRPATAGQPRRRRLVADRRTHRRGRRSSHLRRLLDGWSYGAPPRVGPSGPRRGAGPDRGATAGLETAEEQAARRTADEVLAQRIEHGPLQEFLDDWLDNPLFSSLPPESRCLAERATNRPAGLAASLRACGTGAQESLWERLGELAMPIVLMAGSTDDKFTAIARRMAATIGSNAQVVIEPGATPCTSRTTS